MDSWGTATSGGASHPRKQGLLSSLIPNHHLPIPPPFTSLAFTQKLGMAGLYVYSPWRPFQPIGMLQTPPKPPERSPAYLLPALSSSKPNCLDPQLQPCSPLKSPPASCPTHFQRDRYSLHTHPLRAMRSVLPPSTPPHPTPISVKES